MFREMASEAEPPDVIVCGVPTLELAAEAVEYGQSHNIPVLLDLRDLWPDIWFDSIPTAVRPLARILAGHVFQRFARTCRDAYGLLAITEDFLEWGLHYAGRPRRNTDLVAPLAYSPEEPPEAALRAAEGEWTRRGITGRPDQFVVCFIGTLSRRLARQGFLSDSIAALSLLGRDCPGLRIVVCGGGEDLPRWKAFAESYPQVLTVGRVNHAELWTLLQRSSVGLVPYANSPDFIRSIPNKVAEYLSMGVPIVSSLDGALGRFLRGNHCGTTYVPGDPECLAQRLRALYFDNAAWSAMSNRARRAYADHFVADRVYGDLVAHLKGLMNRRSGADVIERAGVVHETCHGGEGLQRSGRTHERPCRNVSSIS